MTEEASQDFRCFICNIAGLPVKNGIAIFDEDAVLESGLRLSEAVSQIVGRPIDPHAAHSTSICRKCHKTCQEYDEINKRLNSLKSKMADQFRQTLPKYNLSYDTYNKELPVMEVDLAGLKGTTEPTNVKKESTTAPMRKLILPKSKLTPIPPNLVVMNKNKVIQGNINKVVSLKDCVFISPKKVTWPGTSLIKPQLTITTTLKEISDFNAVTKTNTSILNTSSSSCGSIANVSLLVGLPSKNNDQGTVAESKFKEEIPEIRSASADFVDTKGSSTYYLKTDTDFNKILVHSVGQVQKTPEKKMQPRNSVVNFQNSATDAKAEIFPHATATEVSEQSIKESFPKDKLVISKVEIMQEGQDNNSEDDDDGDDTILMDQDGSIIQVMRGKHGELVFPKDEQMSLVVPQGAESDSDTNGRYKIECQDSNDDTHIELQMSEDEETANAIIAAANKKGATYIKMGSGEMYRVKAIKSTVQEQDPLQEVEEAAATAVSTQIVQRDGSVYTCLICKNASKESGDSESVDDAPSEPTKRAEDGAVFTEPCDIMMHLKSAHHLRVYLCPVCGDVFRRRSEHNAHLMQHGEKKKASSQTDRMKQYSCPVCSKKYSSRNLLDEHMNQHTGVRPYTCSTCSKSFASKYTYQAHMKTHTDRPRPFSCTQCNKSFFTFPNLSQHQKTHSGIKEFFCNICGKAFATQHNLDVHGVVHTGDKPFVCGLCNKPFARRAEIRDHMRTHTGERPFECDMCEAKFSQRSNLLSHRRATHLDDKRHACQYCDKRFKRRRLLDYHVKASHTGERPYKCAMCGATFVYPEHYKKHTRAHSGEKPYVCEVSANQLDYHVKASHTGERPYKCARCGATFVYSEHYKKHTRAHSGEKPYVCEVSANQLDYHVKASHTGERPYKCARCGATFVYPEHYKKHTRAHSGEKPYVCEVSANQLDYHVKASHTGERPYKCATCGATFVYPEHYKKHTRAHSGEKPYVCEVSANQLGYHVKASHTGERPYKCATCGATFVYPEHYKKHKRVHSGEKPYVCEVSANQLGYHVKASHTGERPYKCATCGATFVYPEHYKKHKRVHSGEKPYVCEVSANQLDYHVKASHTGERPYKCARCGATFVYPEHYKKHTRAHSGEKPYVCEVSANQLDYHVKASHTGERPYKCATCGATFVYPEHYKKHTRAHSGEKPYVCEVSANQLGYHVKASHTGERPYKCATCGATFVYPEHYKKHKRVHSGEKPYVCEVSANQLGYHVKASHTGERPYKCATCGATFVYPEHYKKHKRVHSGEKPYVCEVSANQLGYHVKASHTGERPYKCARCGATFVYLEHYKKHTRAHSGEKPYVCEVCNRTFNSRDNRNAHRFTHSDKKPYECVVCGAGFMRKPLLYSHMNSQGHLSDIIVVNQARLTDKAKTIAETRKADVIALNEDKLETSRPLTDANISEMFGDMEHLAEAQMETETSDKSNEGEATVNLVQTGGVSGDHSLLALTGAAAADGGGTEQDLLCTTDVGELLAQGSEVLTTDEDGNILRLVQIQLPDGKTGWVALEP